MLDRSEDEPKPRPRWRRLVPRLSVRATMVVVLAIGGWLGWMVQLAEVQRRAVAAIVKAGGSVRYAWAWTAEGSASRNAQAPPWPSWLVEAFGRDYFGDVAFVDFQRAPSTKLDTILREVARLRRLDSLNLNNVPVNDADLALLSGLTSLKHLAFTSCEAVTDAGLAHLQGLVNLKSLWFYNGSRISSAGLVHLRGMHRLISFGADRSRIDDLSPIAHITRLIALHFHGCPIDDRGFQPISSLTELQSLDVSKSNLDMPKLGDVSLQVIARLRRLKHLDLSGNAVSDAGLDQLARIPTLESVLVRRTGVTLEGANALKAKRPGVRVTR